ncbi:MAG: ATP-binding protein [Methylophilaceae bacterium]|nr:ATP-binding protein [Methylophilaceae bacterium]MBL6726541.1 ATP-binding protein [Methylophilaceae bacterium]
MKNVPKKCNMVLDKGLEDLPLITEQLFQFFNEHQNLINPINLLIEELYSNSIYYGKAEKLKVTITLELNNELLSITYKDNGMPYDPLVESENPNIELGVEERQIGGLGIHFVKNLTDTQHYKRDENCNILSLKKNIKSG